MSSRLGTKPVGRNRPCSRGSSGRCRCSNSHDPSNPCDTHATSSRSRYTPRRTRTQAPMLLARRETRQLAACRHRGQNSRSDTRVYCNQNRHSQVRIDTDPPFHSACKLRGASSRWDSIAVCSRPHIIPPCTCTHHSSTYHHCNQPDMFLRSSQSRCSPRRTRKHLHCTSLSRSNRSGS